MRVKVFVIDSMNATIGERILVEYGLQLKDQGKSAEEIVSILEKEKSKIHTMGLLDTLEYLKKADVSLLYRSIHRRCTGHQACGRCLRR